MNRVLRPAPGVFAFYAGRDGTRFAPQDNWVDEGALALGIASYAIVDGAHALVYDTHTSVEHARHVRTTLEAEGVTTFTVVLSHWHLDHVAGTAAFTDGPATTTTTEVIANTRTAAILAEHRAAIEAGTLEGPPAIAPLVLPTRTFTDRTTLTIGPETTLELIHLDIHSDDATVLWWPERGLLFAGDTLEDSVTYVDMPDHFPQHREGLQQLRALGPRAILPNHGDPEVIASGGYPPSFIDATEQYIAFLTDPDRRDDAAPLSDLLTPPLTYYAGYEDVHASNLRVTA